MSKNKIQNLAEIFFKEKTEKNFTPIYAEIINIVRSSSGSIVKNDEDKIQEIVNDVAMQVWSGTKQKNGESIFVEGKSFLSWVYIASKNRAIQMYNKNSKRKEILESELSHDGMEEDFNYFENAMYKAGVADQMEEMEESKPFHDDKQKQADFALDKLRELFKGEEYEILYKAIVNQESPEAIAKEYGINSRITVTSRNRRARNKIISLLEEEIEKSRVKENKLREGNLEFFKGDIKIVCKRISGELNGDYKEYYNDGSVKIEGSYEMGKKSGKWVYYTENGNVDSTLNFSNPRLPFTIYDRFGTVQDMGFLIKAK